MYYSTLTSTKHSKTSKCSKMSKNTPILARKIVRKTFWDTAHCSVDDISSNSRICYVIL